MWRPDAFAIRLTQLASQPRAKFVTRGRIRSGLQLGAPIRDRLTFARTSRNLKKANTHAGNRRAAKTLLWVSPTVLRNCALWSTQQSADLNLLTSLIPVPESTYPHSQKTSSSEGVWVGILRTDFINHCRIGNDRKIPSSLRSRVPRLALKLMAEWSKGPCKIWG